MARAGILGRWAAAVVAGLAFAMGGCEGGGNHPSLEVVRDASLAQQSIEVDVIGADADGVAKYTAGDMGKYFSSKSTLRSAATKHTMKFSSGGADSLMLSKSDPVWKQWEKATNFVLLANIPGMTNKGAADPRRIVVPFAIAAESGNSVKVRMSEDGLAVVPPEKSKQ